MTTATATTIEQGPKYDEMNQKLVNAAGERAGLRFTRGMKLINKVGLLQIHYRKVAKNVNDIFECDRCLAASDINDDACPFCGEGQDETPKPKQKLVQKKTRNAKPSTDVVKGQDPKTEAAPAELVTVNEPEEIAALDEAVRQIVALKAGSDASQWLLGRKILEVEDRKGWRLRRDEAGKPRYRSFGQFCAEEFELSASQCYRLVDVAKTFTEEQVRSLGTTKLFKVLKLTSDQERAALVGRIERENLSAATVAKEVAKLSPGRRETGRNQTPEGTPGSNRKFPEGSITTAVLPGTKNVQFFCFPKSDVPASELRRAHTLEDNPFLTIELPNEVRITVRIVVGSTGLIGQVVTKKVDPLGD